MELLAVWQMAGRGMHAWKIMSRLILLTGIPLMISLFINSLYNFVDSMFVSRISEDALTALSLAAPIQLLVSALGLGNAVGLNAVISRALGRKDSGEVRKAADAAIFIALCSWVVIAVMCLMFVRTYFRWQSGGNQAIEEYGVAYLTVCMLFSFGQMGQWVFDRFVIASGRIVTILKVGLPSTLVQVLTSFVGILMNSILLGFSTTAVAVYGICARISNICTVGVHGINNGLIPVVAYNYGAGKKKRITDGVKWAMVYGVLFYLAFFSVLELLPAMALQIFDASEYMLEIGVPALRILALSWLLSIPGLVLSAALQGLSMGISSMVITMTRQAILPLAFAMVLRLFGNLDVLWIGFLAAEVAGIPLAVFLWNKRLRRIRGL